MRILMLGGTLFVGRHMVDAALDRGHEVTLFTRGRTNPGLFDVEHLNGDRDGGLDALAGRRWDAVIDTSGRLPRLVRQSAALLADAVGRYVFVSSKSVYAAFPPQGVDEDSAVTELADPTTEDDVAHYGGLKVLCERVVQDIYGERALVLRPGLIVGPHDPTDRFTYWPWRIAQGGEILVPGVPARHVLVLDVRDMAAFTIEALERSLGGTFNLVGPRERLTMGDLAATCASAATVRPAWTWIDDDAFLLAEGLVPYRDLPLWMPPGPGREGFMEASVARALAAGLRLRPIQETVADTLAFALRLGPDHAWRAGLSRQREAELLARWHDRFPDGPARA